MSSNDPYERRQRRLQALFDAASTPGSSEDPYEDPYVEEDPYADDGEYGSDKDYEPSSESTESENGRSKKKTVKKTNTAFSTGESESSCSDTDDEDGSCSCSNSDEDDDRTSCSSVLDDNIGSTQIVDAPTIKSQQPSASRNSIENDDGASCSSTPIESNLNLAAPDIEIQPPAPQNDIQPSVPQSETQLSASRNPIEDDDRTSSSSMPIQSNLNLAAPDIEIQPPAPQNEIQPSVPQSETQPSASRNPIEDDDRTSCSSMPIQSNLNLAAPDLEIQPPVSQNEIQPAVSQNEIQPPASHNPDLPTAEEDSWFTTVTDIQDFNFDNSQCGITVDVENMEQVIDFFRLLFPQNFLEYLVNCTNAYGNALCNNNRPHTRHSRKRYYHETDCAEMLKFLGLSLLKGHIKCPTQRNLFSLSDPLYYHPIFNYIMSGRRYEQILRCVCAAELTAKGENKIVKFIDMLTLNFRRIYKASEELSLDESLLLFRGRLHFRQYMKGKKARYGIKFYELTTYDGYVLNMIMYSGKNAQQQNVRDEPQSKTAKLVMRLMRPYLLRGHHLVMDNYYNSVDLSKKLLDLKTHSTGTLRTNRKDNPKFLVKKKLKKGEHIWRRKGKVYVSKWKDRRPVLMITTKKHPAMTQVQNRYGKSRSKPVEVETYNRLMSGIDRSDQMVSYYSSPRKTLRWYKKVLFHLLDITVWNAFYLFKKYKKNNVPGYHYVNYRDALIKTMIGLEGNLKGKDLVNKMYKINDSRRFRPSASNTSQPEQPTTATITGHWPEQMLGRAGTTKKFAFLKCKVCTTKKLRKETSYRCKGCTDKPPLCPSCFEEYHNSISF